jgi:hypothetical protein
MFLLEDFSDLAGIGWGGILHVVPSRSFPAKTPEIFSIEIALKHESYGRIPKQRRRGRGKDKNANCVLDYNPPQVGGAERNELSEALIFSALLGEGTIPIPLFKEEG